MNCITPKQGDWFHIYVVKADSYTEGVFTNRAQAEAYMRDCRAQSGTYAYWNIVSYDTQPHDNNC